MKDFLSKLIKEDIHIDMVGGELSVKFPKSGIDQRILEEIKNKKLLLKEYLNKLREGGFVEVPAVALQDSYPISDAQRRLWVLSQFEGGSVAYNIPDSIHLNRDIDIENFKRAIDATIDRHEILRTVFREDETGEIRQWILRREALGFSIDYQDFRKETNKKEKAEAYVAADAYRAFDLSKGPLLRAALLHVEEEQYVFYFNMHHIISDGWSMEVLAKDVFKYYESCRAGKESALEKLRIQYKDYSAWQLTQLNEDSFKAHKGYWLDRLSGELPQLDLPATKQRPKVKTYNGRGLATYIDKATTSKLNGYIREKGGSLFIGLLTSWNVLMYRYTSQKGIIIGTPVAGREHADLEDQIGFYVNALALRNEVNPEESFESFYNRVKEDTLKSYSHQMYPFDRLVEELDLRRDTSRSAVFDVILILQNNGERNEEVELSEEALNQTVDLGYGRSKFDIEILFQERGDYLSLQITFNPDVYEKAMVEGLIRHYKQLLNALLETPEEKISQIDYLSEQEKHNLLVTFNDTAVACPKDKTIVDLFEEQAAKTPDNIAVVFGDRQLTYRELNEKSNQLAHYLRENYDIQPDDLVGIKQERSEWVIVSILGVLKSGGAYVPIDPEYPQERIDYIEQDINCKVCLDETERSKFKANRERYSKQPVSSTAKQDNLAYVIYTSGSTGKPKGVMVDQKSVIRLVKNSNFIVVSKGDKILGLSSFSFDGSTFDIFMPLLNGAAVVISVRDIFLNLQNFDKIIESQAINSFFLTTVLFNSLVEAELDSIGRLKYILFGGEQVSVKHVKKFKELYPNVKIHHVYGPTENTTFSTWYPIEGVKSGALTIPIGSGVSNSTVYILDENFNIVPAGVTGELYVGGDGLARGYLNQDVLTKEKFIANPFKEGERLYKTGDLGRWLPDGNIEFIGRIDDQLKIRGYRIELGEIEHALLDHEAIKEAVVLARQNQSGEKELVAYITSESERNTSDLRAYLKDKLPVYMLPAYFVQLKAMPLTANGKVDKKYLPDPEGLKLTSGVEYAAPGNETEAKLVKIWEEVLQRKNVGVNDDFFALGGHSLKAVRLSNEYQKELSVKLGLKELFAHTSIASHAALIESSAREEFIQIERVTPQASYPVSDAQRRLWILSQFEEGSVAYNIPRSIHLNQNIEIENFKRAIDATIDRHEILRTVFKEEASGEIRQWILQREALGFAIDSHDFRKETNRKEKTQAYIATDAYQPFDLKKGPLLRAALLQVGEAEYVFYFNMHHIISDEWSMEVLAKDVFKYYESYQAGKEPEIEELRIQYNDYSSWQLAQLGQESFKAHKAYWLDLLSGELPQINLPGSKQRPKIKTANGGGLTTYFDKDLSNKLKTYCKINGGTTFMGILASFNALLYRYTGNESIIIGTAISGRGHVDLHKQIGFYLNTLALRNEVRPSESFHDLLSRIKQTTISAYTHQMYPFDRLVEDLDLQRDTSRHPVFDVMVILQDKYQGDDDFEINNNHVDQIVDTGSRTSKLDLTLSVQERNDYFSCSIEYNTDVYDRDTIEGFMRHFKRYLSLLIDYPDIELSRIDFLFETERRIQLKLGEGVKTQYLTDRTIVQLFESQVQMRPESPALVFGSTKLTYEELDHRSNQIANFLLKEIELKLEDRVGLLLHPGIEVVVSILGILKAGCCYVPMDVSIPEDRMRFIIADAGVRILISEIGFIELINRIQWPGCLKSYICVDSLDVHSEGWEHEIDKVQDSKKYLQKNKYQYDRRILDVQSKLRPNLIISPANLAYIIYTSGSTGQPKGVMIEHRSVVSFFTNFKNQFGIEPHVILGVTTNYTFDISVLEILGGLTQTRSIHLLSDREPLEILSHVDKKEITGLQLTPSRLSQLLAVDSEGMKKLNNLEVLLVGGEPMPISLYEKLKELEGVKVVNVYGPTETTIWSTKLDIRRNTRLSIGGPLQNENIYILDRHQNLLPLGVVGEICVAGAGVARGYVNQEVLTKERFISNLFVEGERLYKTGDLGRWLPDGNIEFLGRKDDQVKIRGYRIELGEIEHALAQNKEIRQAVVLAKENKSGEKELVAYIVSKEEQKLGELRMFLKQLLPGYMIPNHFIQLEKLPLNANGKIDKKLLPDPENIGLSSGAEYVAPRNELEERLVKIWEEVLQRTKIGVNDDFFALGGHSVKALKVVFRVNEEFKIAVKIASLFSAPSIQDFAILIGFALNKNKNRTKMKAKEIEL